MQPDRGKTIINANFFTFQPFASNYPGRDNVD